MTRNASPPLRRRSRPPPCRYPPRPARGGPSTPSRRRLLTGTAATLTRPGAAGRPDRDVAGLVVTPAAGRTARGVRAAMADRSRTERIQSDLPVHPLPRTARALLQVSAGAAAGVLVGGLVTVA